MIKQLSLSFIMDKFDSCGSAGQDLRLNYIDAKWCKC